MIPKIVYCPKCHQRLRLPKMEGNIMVATGFINVECKCGGKVKIKTELKKQEV